MPELEIVKETIKRCVKVSSKDDCNECPYQNDYAGFARHDSGEHSCVSQLLNDALALLNEYEEERLKFIEAVARLTAENEMMKMIYGDQGTVVGELVRCKDCKHVCLCDAEEMFPDMPVYAKCTLTDETHEPEWYCADGERRD